jgi:4-amino-4-deoxy-L-arabinose transferase-like glycosyltransferase
LKNRSRRILLALLVLGFLARLGAGIAYGLADPPTPKEDAFECDTYAWNLAQGRGYRGMSPDVPDQDHLTAYRPPGLSIVWAGLFKVFGHRYDVLKVTHCLAASATILLVYAVGRRCFGETVGLTAACVYAFWPADVYVSSGLSTEAVATLSFMGFIVGCLWFADRPSWTRGIIAGVLLGASAITRPNPIIMFPLVGVWALWQFRRQRAAIIKALVIPLAALAVMVPWWVRNYVVFHTFIPVSTLSGIGLLAGNNRLVSDPNDPKNYGYSVWDSDIPEYHDVLKSIHDEVLRERTARDFAIQWLKDNPHKWLPLAKAKLVRGWTPFLQPSTAWYFRWAMLVSWGPVLILFLIAVIPTLLGFLRSNHPGWIMHLAIVNCLIINIIFWGYARYRHFVEPLCIIIAMEALVVALGILSRVLVYRTSAAGRVSAEETRV